jgi:hypothetical protein
MKEEKIDAIIDKGLGIFECKECKKYFIISHRWHSTRKPSHHINEITKTEYDNIKARISVKTKQTTLENSETALDNPIFWTVKERDKYWKEKIRKLLSKPHTLESLTLELERLLE